MTDPQELIGILTDAGVLGILVLAVWAFMTGKILSAGIVAEQVKAQTRLAESALSNGIERCIKEAVREGFIEAWYQIKKGDK